jgi:lysophospholipase L1-like esterase
MLNGVAEKGLRRDHFFRVRAHPGFTSEDMVEAITPYARQRPDNIVLHIGTNDLTKKSNKDPSLPIQQRPKIDTISNLRQVFNIIRREAPSTQIVFSLATLRLDKPELRGLVSDLNNRITQLCTSFQIPVLAHDNFDANCLTKPQRTEPNGHRTGKPGGGLHSTPNGNKVLANNFIEFFA